MRGALAVAADFVADVMTKIPKRKIVGGKPHIMEELPDPEGYLHRLKLLREVISGENRTDFAKRLGIEYKRWDNYERGYPMPRQTAFHLMKTFPGMSVEWLWFNMFGNLSQDYAERIRAAELVDREEAKAQKELDAAKAKLEEIKKKRLKGRAKR
jgi:hypothetical protein